MKPLDQYSIPLLGLTNEMHHFEFNVGKDFFEQFEESLLKDGTFKIKIEMLKQEDAMFLEFEINGTVKEECDRCLANIDLPVTGNYSLIAKYAEEEKETEDVIYIVSDESKLQLAKTIYDFIGLSIPLVKRYDCENETPAVCDNEMLAKINTQVDEKVPEKKKDNPIWDKLKDFGKE